MTTKNNELSIEIDEVKTDIVLKDKENQRSEGNNPVQENCETETRKRLSFSDPTESDELSETETKQGEINSEWPMLPAEKAHCSETETDNPEEESPGENSASLKEINSESETDKSEGNHYPGLEFTKLDEYDKTDTENEGVISDGADDVGVIKETDTKIVEVSLNAGKKDSAGIESEKPKKKRGLLKLGKKAEEEVESETAKKNNQRKEIGETAPSVAKTETEINPKEEDGVVVDQAKKKTRTLAKPVRQIMTIDGERTVQTEKDKEKDNLIDLYESMKSGKVMTGIIQGVERMTEKNQPFAVLYHGVYKIIIPATELIDEPTDYRGLRPKDVHHYLLTKRLGAEIDFIIKGVDAKTKLAVASRKDAMNAKRKAYYFGHDRDGNNLLYPGIFAEARVVSVIRSGIFVDVFGVETFVSIKELSYQRMMDASQYYQSGQRILVKILEIDIKDRNNIKVGVSVKQAAENPYEKALRKYTVGNCYVGTVSYVDTTGVFVALDGGIDCLCSHPTRGRPPRGARVTVRILGINYDSNRMWGVITHIATPR